MQQQSASLLLVAMLLAVLARSAEFHVACDAKSKGLFHSGQMLSSLRQARDKIRQLPRPLSEPVTVTVSGACVFDSPDEPLLHLNSTALDSGTPECPITYKVQYGAQLIGGYALYPTGWEPYSAEGNIWTYDLSRFDFGVNGYGKIAGHGALGQCSQNRVELFYSDKPMVLARYPNVDSMSTYNGPWMHWMTIAGMDSSLHNAFYLSDERASKWAQEIQRNPAAYADVWMHGFWSFDWADSYIRLTNISQAADGRYRVTYDTATPPVYEIKAKARLYLVNLLSELDMPGEYFIDIPTKTLYFSPPATTGSPTAAAYLSAISTPMIRIADGVSHVHFDGFKIAFGRSAAIVQTTAATAETTTSVHQNDRLSQSPGDSKVDPRGARLRRRLLMIRQAKEEKQQLATPVSYNLAFTNLTISCVNYAISLTNVSDAVVDGLLATDLGCRGVSVSGGNKLELISGRNIIRDSKIHTFARWTRTYNPAVSFNGVGLTVLRNEVGFGPHEGMSGAGNNHLFKENYFHNLCFEATDSGAFYIGRSWVNRGITLLANVFINISALEPTTLGWPSVQAIYLDDEQSGVTVVANACRNSFQCVVVGGGRDNAVINNTCERIATFCVHFDNRGMGWQKEMCTYDPKVGKIGQLVQQLFAVNYKKPPYSVQYPELPGLLSDFPCVPVNNSFYYNRFCKVKSGFISEPAATIALWHSFSGNNTQYTSC